MHIVIKALTAVALTAVSAMPAQSQPAPLVPFHTAYTYWDHHWIQWLPTHPRYEAIEASIASGGDPVRRYIRVWFTERTPPKNQVFFFDDETLTRSVFGTSHYRPIRYALIGPDDAPSGLDLSFDDEAGRPVAWRMTFAPTQRLSTQYAGLTPQGGHGAAGVQILWVLGQNATTSDSEIAIGGETFRATRENVAILGKAYAAGYTRGVSGIIFPFGPSTVTTRPGGLTDSWGGGRAFELRPGSPPTFVSAPFGYRGAGRIELVATETGALASYRHRWGNHVVAVDFTPPVPHGHAGFEGRYAIAIDWRAPILAGKVTGDPSGLLFTPEFPAWAQAAPLRSDIRRTGEAAYELRVSRGQPR